MRLTPAQNKVIDQYILDAIDPEAYEVNATTDNAKLEFLNATFNAEKGWELKRPGANRQKVFMDWIMGLPSCFNIEFENYKILELAKTWGSIPEDATEKQEDKILENYWSFMAFRTLKLIG
jgi:hypothetical protein